MSRINEVEAVCEPDVPLTVTAYWPTAAVPEAVSVNVLLVPIAGFGENNAVTPLGRPDAASFTLPENPDSGFTYTVVVANVPWPMLTPLLVISVNARV